MARGKGRISHARGRGTLIIIGGHEEKAGGEILKQVARRVGRGKLIISPVASEIPDEMWRMYKRCFGKLGVRRIERLDLVDPSDARNHDYTTMFKGAKAVFFTGGDQLRITTKIAGSDLMDQLVNFFDQGGVIAGTSAGAAALGHVMFVGGPSDRTPRVGSWKMAPGLGFHENILIDNHFAERGRLGRLMGAVSLNPGMLGMGIDENTAVVVHKNRLSVIGEGGVYMVCGMDITFTNSALARDGDALSVHDVRVHILSPGEAYDLKKRRPVALRKIRSAQ